MTIKKLLEWCGRLVKENPVFVASVVILAMGGIPLLFYALHIDQLPDFSLADLTGTLIASFITELLIGALLVLYLLLAGFAARKVVQSFYPHAVHWSPVNPGRAAIQDEHTAEVDYLTKGRFIVGATAIAVLFWLGLVFWLYHDATSRAPWYIATMYWGALLCAFVLTAFDWRRGRRWLKYVAGILLLVCAGSLVIWLIGSPGPVPASASSASLPAHAAGAPGPASAAGFASSAGPASAPGAANAVGSNVDLSRLVHASAFQKVVSRHPVLCTAGLVALVVALAALYGFRKKIAAALGALLSRLMSGPTARLLGAKCVATVAFGAVATLPALFLMLIVDGSAVQLQVQTAILGGVLLLYLNWAAFAAHDTTLRAMTAVITFWCGLFLVPLLGQNPAFFPKIVVSALGFGNLHAASVTLSAQQCATLQAWGVDCESKKDAGITVTNVNILNRLGNTVSLELLVHDQPACTVANGPTLKLPATDEHGTLALRELMQCRAFPVTARNECDPLLLERAKDGQKPKPGVALLDALRCFRLSVPKEQLVGFTADGSRRYDGGFSQYVDAIRRPKPAADPPKPAPPASPHPHPKPSARPCACGTAAAGPAGS